MFRSLEVLSLLTAIVIGMIVGTAQVITNDHSGVRDIGIFVLILWAAQLLWLLLLVAMTVATSHRNRNRHQQTRPI